MSFMEPTDLKQWESPELIVLGDLAELTTGVTGAAFDGMGQVSSPV
jgi:hypothetical protein